MSLKLQHRHFILLYATAVILIGYWTYFRGYSRPDALFWDENYHIPSAMKYLEGVWFLEPHPPLGKLFIALGEKLLHPNEEAQIVPSLSVDYLKTLPAGFSFEGVRLFPTLFGWFSAPLLFGILVLLTRNAHLSFLFTLPYLFENGIILQSRAAMLDSTQMFFVLLTILAFAAAHSLNRTVPFWLYLVQGICAGLALSVKVNSGIVVFLIPYLACCDYSALRQEGDSPESAFWSVCYRGAVYALGTAVTFVALMWLHFALTPTVTNDRYYEISPAAREVVQQKHSAALRFLPMMLTEAYQYSARYEQKVPRLDICKAGENGSPPMLWTLGGKTINMRWAKQADGRVAYLYLVNNPIVTGLALVAVLLGIILVGAFAVFGLPLKPHAGFGLVALFLGLYLINMAVMIRISRVMYLYHYFIPLILAVILAALVTKYLFQAELQRRDPLLLASAAVFAAQLVAAFWFFAPFSYYIPVTSFEFMRRAWFDFWQLTPV